jgi:hypothetical protein
MAGDRFGDLNLHFADNREIVETELCASSGVWANALDQLGVTIEDIRNGSVDIFLCGETWAHRIPKQRILAILQGHQESRGQYSVLSGPETAAIAERLTQLGY